MSCSIGEVPETLSKSEGLHRFKVPSQQISPSLDGTAFTNAPCQSSDLCYVKRPSLLFYRPGDDALKKLMLQEVQKLEALKESPHPNVVKYHGCIEKDNLLIGLCLDKYSETLAERVRRKGTELSKNHCLKGVQNGIQHLRSLGYCHNDINPTNIMFKEDDTPVIIDFDSCVPTGQKLGSKAGTMLFSDEHATHSMPENDVYSLCLVKEFMEDHANI